jgi:hypothetical protein
MGDDQSALDHALILQESWVRPSGVHVGHRRVPSGPACRIQGRCRWCCP